MFSWRCNKRHGTSVCGNISKSLTIGLGGTPVVKLVPVLPEPVPLGNNQNFSNTFTSATQYLYKFVWYLLLLSHFQKIKVGKVLVPPNLVIFRCMKYFTAWNIVLSLENLSKWPGSSKHKQMSSWYCLVTPRLDTQIRQPQTNTKWTKGTTYRWHSPPPRGHRQ